MCLFGGWRSGKHAVYLGLPTVIGAKKKQIFAGLKERIWKRVQGWKEKGLSSPGREVIIKSALHSIPTYMMSIFRIPDSTSDEIHSMLARFWWGAKGEERKIHWMSWARLCKPKRQGGMGFRDLKCFNEALLAKQGWRLTMYPDTLAARILKCKYYKNDPSLEARRSYDPSYTWRSIWGAKHLLKEGFKWRVGNGRTVKIFEHSWLLGGGAGNVLERPINVEEGLTVSELLLEDGSWNIELSAALFDAHTVEKIMQVPIGAKGNDEIYWSCNKDGDFTVESAYWLGFLGPTSGSGTNVDEARWQKIWHMEIQNKLKHFLWKSTSSILATKKVLQDRHISESNVCGICIEAPETNEHMLFDCTHTRDLWRGNEWDFLPSPKPEWKELFDWCCTNHRDLVLPLITRAWGAWTIRNKALFEEVAPKPDVVMAGFEKYVADFQDINRQNKSGHRGVGITSLQNWTKPNPEWVKINVDAAVAGNSDIGLGAVIRGCEGSVLWAGARRVKARWDPETAEFAAGVFVLEMALAAGWQKVVLESDSLSLVSTLQTGKIIWAPKGMFIDEARSILSSFSDFSLSHVRRNGNTVAHYLARPNPTSGNVCSFF